MYGNLQVAAENTLEAPRGECGDQDEDLQRVCSESAVVWGRDLGCLCRGSGLVGGIPEQLLKKNSSIILDGEGHRGGGAETVLWTADYRGDSQAKADEVVRPCAKNGPGETAEGHVLGNAGR